MNVKELADRLSMFRPDAEVMILDGFNGGGDPREINFGPCTHKITKKEANGGADCEGRAGESVLVIGYGCY